MSTQVDDAGWKDTSGAQSRVQVGVQLQEMWLSMHPLAQATSIESGAAGMHARLSTGAKDDAKGVLRLVPSLSGFQNSVHFPSSAKNVHINVPLGGVGFEDC